MNVSHYVSHVVVAYKEGGEGRFARFANVGRVWDEHSQTLDWLGISIHISSWGRSASLEAKGRAALATNNPLRRGPTMNKSADGDGGIVHSKADARAVSVHKWMLKRVHKGYHNLGKVRALTGNNRSQMPSWNRCTPFPNAQ